MKRIAVTGISGYIGIRLLIQLEKIDEVDKIIGIDIRPPRYDSTKLVFYQQDTRLPMIDIFADNRIDCAVHLAFVVKPSRHQERSRQTDLDGASSFLQACENAGVGHIVYLSSHTVYGAHSDSTLPLSEDSPLRPLESFQYSRDKAESEQLFRSFADSHPDTIVTILRSCPVIGPNAGGSVISSMFQAVIIRVAGHDPPLQFTHEGDLTRLISTVLKHQKPGLYNVAGDGYVRYSDLAEMCGKRSLIVPEWLLHQILSISWKLHLQNESPPSGLEFIKYPPLINTDCLKKELGFSFDYSSREALASFINTQVSGQG